MKQKLRRRRKVNTAILTGVNIYMFCRISAEYMTLKHFSPADMTFVMVLMLLFVYRCGVDNREEYEENMQERRRRQIRFVRFRKAEKKRDVI